MLQDVDYQSNVRRYLHSRYICAYVGLQKMEGAGRGKGSEKRETFLTLPLLVLFCTRPKIRAAKKRKMLAKIPTETLVTQEYFVFG